MNLQELYKSTLEHIWKGTRGEETATRNARSAVVYFGATTKLTTITTPRILAYRKHMGGELSPATINRKLSALGRMLSHAVELGELPARPLIQRLPEPEHRTRYLTLTEETHLFSHVLDQKVRRLLTFLVETGLRVGEALRLRWRDVTEHEVFIRNSKTSTPRRVPLTPVAAQMLPERYELDGPWRDLKQERVNRKWAQARKAASLDDDPEMVPHILRHTCASRLVQAGVPIESVQKWLGHKHLSMTMRYAHLAPEQLDKAADRLEHFRAKT